MGVDCLILDAQHNKHLIIRQNVVSLYEDRISRLPEDLLAHILSFLLPKDLLTTSLLSTKWKHSWTTVTTLRFTDYSFTTSNGLIHKEYFAKLIDKVLLHGSPVIQNLHLSCSQPYDESLFSSWISAAISRNVRRLHISSCFFQRISLPYRLYNSHFVHSVTELNIHMHCTFTIPTSICFSSLKILKLQWVNLLNEYASCSNELHMTFPLLEELSLSYCKWREVNVVNVDAPKLKIFSFSNSYKVEDYVIRIHGLSLEKIDIFGGYEYQEYVLTNPSSVKHASIYHDIHSTEDRTKSSLFTCSLFRQFFSLKFLTLAWQSIECIEDLQALPTANNLIQLTITNAFLEDVVHIGKLIAFLWSLPVLESLDINLETQGSCSNKMVLEAVPPCFQTHLKVVKFHISKNTEVGLEFVKLFLKNAVVLQKMIIYGVEIYIEEIKEKLVEFPRGSHHASISFNE